MNAYYVHCSLSLLTHLILTTTLWGVLEKLRQRADEKVAHSDRVRKGQVHTLNLCLNLVVGMYTFTLSKEIL